MIKLADITNMINLQLDIVGYEFSENEYNWCLRKVIVQKSGNQFEKNDPSLEITDLYKLYDWFNDLSKGRLPRDAEFRFTEPCFSLAFISYKNQIVIISIMLNYGFEPNFCFNYHYKLQDVLDNNI